MKTGRRRKKMNKTKFKNIHSLDDIHKLKLRLGKKLRATENSISTKTELGKLLLDSSENMSDFFSKQSIDIEDLEYLLPLGVKYFLKILKNKPARKQFKRISIYSGIGSILALFLYQYLEKRKD